MLQYIFKHYAYLIPLVSYCYSRNSSPPPPPTPLPAYFLNLFNFTRPFYTSSATTMFHVPITRRRFFFADPHFAANWRDYEQVRGGVLCCNKEKRPTWKQLEADFCQIAPCMADDLVGDDLKK